MRPFGIVASALVLLALSACGGAGGGGGGDNTSPLSSLAGRAIGYPLTAAASLQAFSPADGAQLAAGTVSGGPAGASFTATLTPIGVIPASAFGYFDGCGNVTVTPNDVGVTAVLGLGVADSQGLFGVLLHTTSPTLTVGDSAVVYLAATKSANVTGSCVVDGVNHTYAITLSRGWTRVETTVTALDAFGQAAAATWRSVAAAPANAEWYYTPISLLSASAEADTAWSKVLALPAAY